MATRKFLLPDVGEGLTEAEILTWHVKPGDAVKVNDVIVEIETAKASVELPCPFEGTVVNLLVPEGQVVPVGTPIIEVDVAGVGDAPAAPTPAAQPAAAPGATTAVPVETVEAAAPAKREPVLVGYGVEGARTARRAKVAGAPARARTASTSAAPMRSEVEVLVKSKPPVRLLAKERGVDLRTVTATGPHGDITRDDVMRAVGGGNAAAAPTASRTTFTPTVVGTPKERIPVRGVTRSMAEAMVSSKFTAPHVTCWLEVDVTAATAMVQVMRNQPEFAGARVTMLTLAAAGLLKAAEQYPRINSSWIDGPTGAEIVIHGHVGIGIAVAGSKGLTVPVIQTAESLGLPGIAQALSGLVERARNGTTPPAEMMGGTISITNIGALGMDGGTPILVPGQAAILALGRTVRKPWVVTVADTERVEIRDIATLALSFDHRLVDGELGSKALSAVADFMSSPSIDS
ncbi:MAG: hypothetical protein RL745_85 [Actinomycetota bacterium]